MSKTTPSSINRRDFLRNTALTGGGLILSFSSLKALEAGISKVSAPAELTNLNAYLKIGTDGVITLLSPNPEVGQNIKTAMPMIVAEDLDVDWNKIKVEQAPLDKSKYDRQVAGGSGSIRLEYNTLRKAGATARRMLMDAAAQTWNVPVNECTTHQGVIHHKTSGRQVRYHEVAAKAATLPVPADVELKDKKDFKIIGQNYINVDTEAILTGEPVFGMDFYRPGMFYANIVRPPAFGQTLVSVDDQATRKLPGVVNVVTFDNMVAVVGKSTWQVMKGATLLRCQWKDSGKTEDSAYYTSEFTRLIQGVMENPKRSDGDVFAAFGQAVKVLEATYEAPFLAHAPMEPMNFFAHVQGDKAEMIGPTQTPFNARNDIAKKLGIPAENVRVQMTRQGGGFGRRLKTDFAVEAATLSSIIKAPVLVVWTRQDDMTGGSYRPAGMYHYRAGLDANNKLIAWHEKAAAINTGNGTRENNFPAGCVPNLRVDYAAVTSDVTIGAWRAPNHNFIAYSEESFIDEIAHSINKDPVQFRLDLLEEARKMPADLVKFDIDRYKKVIETVAELSGWGKPKPAGIFQGIGVHYSFNAYAAQVVDISVTKGKIKIHKVYCAADCGLVINPNSARNQVEGGIIDGIGHALYGELTIKNGEPQEKNFSDYQLIRINQVPYEIETVFIENDFPPSGLGEPGLPPAGAAIANAIYAATGVRIRRQPLAKTSLSSEAM